MIKYNEIIVRNPTIMMGKPVIKGTRITVELLLKKMSEGASISDLLLGYPFLKVEEIYAVLAYASHVIANEEVIELAK